MAARAFAQIVCSTYEEKVSSPYTTEIIIEQCSGYAERIEVDEYTIRTQID